MSELKIKFKKKYLYLALILISLTIQATLFQNCGKMQSLPNGSVGLGSSVPSPCDLPWGPVIQDGQVIPAFQAMSVPNGQTCASQLRVCSNGDLSGTYQYESCTVAPPPPPTGSFTHFVRPDGGTAAQCTGKTNAAYSGSGTNQNCAFKSIAYALGMGSGSKLVSGNKLYIESGTYKVGYGQPGAELNTNGLCGSSYTQECTMGAVPSGVTIEGNCTNRPKIVGVEGAQYVLNLTKSSDVTLKCLEITDNVQCIVNHNTANGQQIKACKKDAYPRGEWAYRGLTASDSARVLLDRVNIHGLAMHGINAARLTDWTLQDSNIDANGWAGWDGGFGATTSSNSGTMKFLRTSISYNGCIDMGNGTYEGCWGQKSGGYGDGLGTEATGGTWIFDGVVIEGNTSDGIDMLYVKNPGGNVTVKNSYVAHNAGNQVKTNQKTVIENNVIVADCAFHEAFGGTMTTGEYCRASGNALSIGINGSEVADVKNNTITSEGDCLIMTSGTSGGVLNITGNILDGRTDYTSGGTQLSCFNYNMGSGVQRNMSSNLIYNVKEGCQAGQICQLPQFVNSVFETFDPHLKSTSPAVGLGADLSLVPLP